MTANKMPEMPEALVEACWHAGMRRDIERPVEAYGRTCFDAGYLAGIAAARHAVASDIVPPMKCWSVGYTAGRIDSRTETLANLSALEQGVGK